MTCGISRISKFVLRYFELKPLFARLEPDDGIDHDLRHAQPEAVLGLVVLGVPGTALSPKEAYVAGLAEGVVGAADRACGVGADPVFGLDQEHAVADLVAHQFGDGGRAERTGAVGPSLSLTRELGVGFRTEWSPRCRPGTEASRTGIGRCRPETRRDRPGRCG